MMIIFEAATFRVAIAIGCFSIGKAALAALMPGL
jgi:hypothetical protein